MRNTVEKEFIQIYEDNAVRIGADQRWYPQISHRLSGCGPTTAALIMMYMANAFPDTCRQVYPYDLPAHKADFIEHMARVREFVKPGMKGLTDPRFFASSTVAFAADRGVKLTAYRIMPNLSVGVAFGFVKKAVNEGYLPALLILRNPAKTVRDFTWHWMNVTGYDDETQTIFIYTNGGEFELSFSDVWNQKRPYKAGCVYFYPG